jgi:phospholipase C
VTRQPSSTGVPGVTPSPDPPFDFTRLGVRVPVVFISQCIPPNTVLNDRDYEHSSVVATVRKLFCPGSKPLTWREAQASTFDDVLTLTGDAIRTDVVKLPNPAVSQGIQIQATAEQRTATDLSVLMQRPCKTPSTKPISSQRGTSAPSPTPPRYQSIFASLNRT